LRHLKLKIGLKAEYKIGNIKQKIEKREKREKLHLDLTCSAKPTSTAHQKPRPSPAAEASTARVPLRQKKIEEGVVLIFTVCWRAAQRRGAFLLELAPPPSSTV
jgi:hypothetical protein